MFQFVSVLLGLSLVIAAGHDHHHHAHESPEFKYTKKANVETKKPFIFIPPKQKLRTDAAEQLWMETGSAVLLISLAPFVLLCLLPDLNKHQRLLKVLLAFAAGGLLGDAFLHLIPHAVNRGGHSSAEGASTLDHQHDHQHHMIVGLSIVSGIFMFLSIEKLIRLFQQGSSGHSHSNSAQSVPALNSNGGDGSKGKNKTKNKSSNSSAQVQKQEKKTPKPVKEFRVTGYLNLAADFTHNFTDGLAIGASFLISRNLGFVTTMTVLFHELPHEIGDYAILIQSGFSARKAMFLQLTTALGAALGASLSLLAAGLGPASLTIPAMPQLTDDLINSCILPFTAGGFIYIAMTSVLPDLLTSSKGDGFMRRFVQNVAEMCALVFGIGMMALLGTME